MGMARPQRPLALGQNLLLWTRNIHSCRSQTRNTDSQFLTNLQGVQGWKGVKGLTTWFHSLLLCFHGISTSCGCSKHLGQWDTEVWGSVVWDKQPLSLLLLTLCKWASLLQPPWRAAPALQREEAVVFCATENLIFNLSLFFMSFKIKKQWNNNKTNVHLFIYL